MKHKLLMGLIVLGLFSPCEKIVWGKDAPQESSTAQETVIDQGDPQWISLWQRIQEVRLVRLKEDLKLSEAEAGKLFPQLRTLDDKKREIGKERLMLLRQIKKGGASDEEMARQLSALEANSNALMELRKEIQGVLKSHLTPGQQGQYILFQQKFKKELREIIRSEKKARQGGLRSHSQEDSQGEMP